MSKHTPGPWRYFGGEIVQHIKGTLGDPTICSLIGPGGDGFVEDDDEYKANARLIAAAPDLLEALKFVIRGVPDTWEGVEKARAAIAKAEGQA